MMRFLSKPLVSARDVQFWVRGKDRCVHESELVESNRVNAAQGFGKLLCATKVYANLESVPNDDKFPFLVLGMGQYFAAGNHVVMTGVDKQKGQHFINKQGIIVTAPQSENDCYFTPVPSTVCEVQYQNLKLLRFKITALKDHTVLKQSLVEHRMVTVHRDYPQRVAFCYRRIHGDYSETGGDNFRSHTIGWSEKERLQRCFADCPVSSTVSCKESEDTQQKVVNESEESANTQQQKVVKKLRLGAVPDVLPCREQEFARVEQFFENIIMGSKGDHNHNSNHDITMEEAPLNDDGTRRHESTMLVYGLPGTGKTATITAVKRRLTNKYQTDNSDAPAFRCVYINAMKLGHPDSVWKTIYKLRYGKKLSGKDKRNAKEILQQQMLKNHDEPPTILIIDEVDMLITPSENILYEIYGLPYIENANWGLITLCNTLDIASRVKGRIGSRAQGIKDLLFEA